MSAESDALRQQYPHATIWYLKPRTLDVAVAMAEERSPKEVRLFYSAQQVIGILESQGWPSNKIAAYINKSGAWAERTARAPMIASDEEIQKLVGEGEEDNDGFQFAWD